MKPDECIFFQLAKAHQAGIRFWSERAARFNLTAVQAMVLNFLYGDDITTPKELGSRTGLDGATLTGIIDRLEAAGLVERRRDLGDRRALRIGLTGDGRKTARLVAKEVETANRDFLARLGPSGEKELREFLLKIKDTSTEENRP